MKKVVAFLSAAAVIGWCIYSAQINKTVKVDTIVAQAGQLVLCVDGEGQVEAKESFAAVMPVSGKISYVNVTEGQSVSSYSTLFSVEPYAGGEITPSSEYPSEETAAQGRNLTNYAELLRQAQGSGLSLEAYTELIEKAKAASSVSAPTMENAGAQTAAMQVNSEIAGRVLAVNITKGSYAASGSVGVFVGSEERVVRAYLYEEDFARVKEGQSASVKLKNTGITVEGIVKSKSQTLKRLIEAGVPAGEVTVSLPENNIAEVGSSAYVTIEYDRVDQAVLIPLECILKDSKLRYVFVVSNGKTEKRLIKTGLTDGDNIQVLDGIAEGERLVVNPPESMSDGEKVAMDD